MERTMAVPLGKANWRVCEGGGEDEDPGHEIDWSSALLLSSKRWLQSLRTATL